MRRLLAAALAAACAALMVAACVGWWVSRTALDTPRFVAVAGPVIDQPPVQTSLSTAIAGELTSLVGLPQLTGLVRREVASVVAGPTFRGVWYASVTVAHRDIVQALTGPTGPTAAVTGSGGTVSVDVIDVVGQVLAAMPPSPAALLGQGRVLALSPGQTPAEVRIQVAKYLGHPLPPGFATVPVATTETLDRARTAVRVFDGSVVVLGVAAALALMAALVVSRRRLRTVGQVGVWVALFTALAYVGAQRLGTAAAATVPAGPVRPAVSAVVAALFDSLRAPAVAVCAAGVAVAVVTHLPGRHR